MEENKEKKNAGDVIRVRGTGTFYLLKNEFDCVAQKPGKPKQTDVRKYGNARAYTTTGSEPKRVITLECREDAADPYSEFVSQFINVIKSECSQDIPKDFQSLMSF